MKKLLTTLSVALMTLMANAQASDNETLTFLGIPIDGSKTEMIRQLEGKGFKYERMLDLLTGKINGEESFVFIQEHEGKVYRVDVSDTEVFTKEQVIIRYNNLLSQFKQDSRYGELEEYLPIPEEEDISYEMRIHKKVYAAVFCLIRDLSEEEMEAIAAKAKGIEDENELASYLAKAFIEGTIPGRIWFEIKENKGEYWIQIYFENRRNRPREED